MIYEITQIQRFIAEKYNLPLDGEGNNVRIVGDVPDGEHVIPLGASEKKFHVRIQKGFVYIGDPVLE